MNRLRTTRNAEEVRKGRRDWYRIEAKAGRADVYIYDEIGFFGITASEFVSDLRSVDTGKLTVHINSPGGDVFDGIAIHTALKEHPADVEVRVDSLAASIASVIAMAGDHVVMARHSTFMIHEPFGMVLGNSADMRSTADVLDRLGDTIAGVYADRAGGSVREWRAFMEAETWYSDQEAVDAGLADEVSGDAQAKNAFDLSIFANVPQHLLTRSGMEREPTKREIETALRDAGLSRTKAAAAAARVWEAVDESQGDPALRDLSDFLHSLNKGAAA